MHSILISVLVGSCLMMFQPIETAGDILNVMADQHENPTNAFRTIQSAVYSAKPGDQIIIGPGTYRENIQISRSGTPESPIIVEGSNAGEIWISGADLVASNRWRKVPGDGNQWRIMHWTYHGVPWSSRMSHPDDLHHQLIGRTEQLVMDGVPLNQVLDAQSLVPGKFHADPVQDRILTVSLPEGENPAAHILEASTRAVLLHVTGSNVIVRNLNFRFASNRAQEAAVRIEGTNNVLQNCIIERTNGLGAAIGGESNRFQNVTCRSNGQMGMAGGGVRNEILQCRLERNNTKGFSKMWEAGGIKVVGAREFRISRCLAIGNDGPGFWFDIDNCDSVVEKSYSAENNGPGIFIEISEHIHVKNNLCVRNGLKDEDGCWGHAGILLGESMNCRVERNVCLGNRTGIAIRQQEVRKIDADPQMKRTEAKIYFSHGHVIQKNILGDNLEWQLGLFLDNAFFAEESASSADRSDPEFHYLDPSRREWDIGRNVYYVSDSPTSRGLICWGAPWLPKHSVYRDINIFQKEKKQESGSLLLTTSAPDWRRNPASFLKQSQVREPDAGWDELPELPMP